MKTINLSDIGRSVMLSLIVHAILALAILPISSIEIDVEFGVLFATDIALLAVNSIVPIAVYRGKIRWHDPLVWLFGMLLGISCTILAATMADPTYVKMHLSYGSELFEVVSTGAFLMRLAEAEMLLITFASIVLYFNRNQLGGEDAIKPNTREAISLIPVTLLFSAAGIYGFIHIWTLANLSEMFTSQMGYLDESLRGDGNGRYWILLQMGLTAFPLFISCALAALSKERFVGLGALRAIGPLLPLLGAVPSLVTGSRISVVFYVASAYIQLKHLGFRVGKASTVINIMVMAVTVFYITVVRQNQFAGESIMESVRDIGGTVEGQILTRGSERLSFLLDLDRIGIVAMVIEFTANEKPYLYGESLVAGVWDLMDQAAFKLVGLRLNGPSTPRLATTHLTDWRLGTELGSATPPSYAGEFFMEGGIIGLVVLSWAFGIMFRFLRVRLFRAKGMFSRYAWCSTALCFAFGSSVEISVVFVTVFTNLFTVLLLCWLGGIVLGGGGFSGASERVAQNSY